MKITAIKLGRISVPLRVPFKTALRRVDSVEDIIVEVHTDTGEIGYGEAPPTGAITGDTTGAIIGAITDHIRKALVGRDIDDFEDLTTALDGAVVKNSSAKAAVDMALWDLYGQKYQIPVYKLLGGARKKIITDITISVNSPEEMARDAVNAIKRGYDTLKVKVGVDPTLDVARLKAIRDAVGSAPRIRIDANQAWAPKEAVRLLNEMQESGLAIELVEQPVKAHDLEGLTYVTERSYVPVLADESVFSAEGAPENRGNAGSGPHQYQAHEMWWFDKCPQDCCLGGDLWHGMHDWLYVGGQSECQRGCASSLCQKSHYPR